MGKLFFLTCFFFITPVILGFSLLFFLYLSFQKNPYQNIFNRSVSKNSVAYAALPSSQNSLKTTVDEDDARIESLRQFFKRYKSPLEPYAKEVVKAADTYNLDHRLIPAIAMQESNLCQKIPDNSYNCWGFGIYGKKVTRFENYPEAIETVTKTLAKHYRDKGLETPNEIMTKYTPGSNGSWANGVNYFMNILSLNP